MVLLPTTTTFLLALLPLGVLAAPKYPCKPFKTTYTAQYDDLPFVEPGPNPIPPHYYGLSYFTFQVDQYDFFIPPTSGNQWTMAFGGSGNISVPDQPPKTTLALHSFSYACVSGVPQPECAISVWGHKASPSGRPHILKREIIYPRLDPGHPVEDYIMNATTFGREWTGLKSLGFSIRRKEDGGDMFGGLALDDVKYTLTTEC